MKGFLYGQTEYNLLNNAIHLDDYIKVAKESSFTFLSITDSSMYGAYKFYNKCLAAGLKPIIGLEIKYLDTDSYESKILAYAKNNTGFKNLLKISTFLNTNSLPNGLDFLNDYKDGLAFVAVYNESEFERLYYSKALKEVTDKLKEYSERFDFYVGYSFTNRLDRLNSNQEFKDFANARGVKTLPIHNCRYLNDNDIIIYEALTKINGNPQSVKEYEDYSFDKEPLITDESTVFINSIKLDLYEKKLYLPKYPNTKGQSAKDFLAALSNKGLYRRMNGKILANYQDRLNYELSIIDKMGYNDYFLIVWDFILYAKKKGILVGPGRGTVSGSLVAYCLGITEIDPLKYNLWFERFLNPERISMPDIDTDFPDNHRDEVITYVKNLYGAKHVCNISAYNTFLVKSAIRDLGRVTKMDNSRQEEIIKLVEETNDFETLLNNFKERKDIYDFLYIVRGLEGLPRHISTHAAGIIISSLPLDEIIPLQNGINDLYQSQFEAVDLEQIGMLKMDFLGIRNLGIIDDIIKSIPNFSIEALRKIPLNDAKTYKLLQEADTLGVFQLESDGIRKVLYNLKPEKFEDIVAVLALYRPGPMDNIDEFIARRHGKSFTYLHKALEPILKSTYGIIVYQEQIMLIAQAFAGFSLGEADILRRAVAKKKESELLKLEESFIKRSIANGFSLEVATSIYQYILKFANYGFNKSHTVAYGLVSYQMAYLKANYFSIFISKILNNVIGATKTMVSYINYAKAHNVNTFKPNINISSNIFEVNKVGMFMPFQAIHSIGEVTAKEIVEERNKNGLFKDFNDFKNRTNLGKNILEALIFAGAFDGFGLTKKNMIEASDSINEIFARHLDDRIQDNTEYDFSYLQQKELAYLGFNLTYDLFVNVNAKRKKLKATPLNPNAHRSIIVFDKIKEVITKKSLPMLSGVIKDETSSLDFVIFPQDYEILKIKIDYNILYVVNYNVILDERTKRPKAIIKFIEEVQV